MREGTVSHYCMWPAVECSLCGPYSPVDEPTTNGDPRLNRLAVFDEAEHRSPLPRFKSGKTTYRWTSGPSFDQGAEGSSVAWATLHMIRSHEIHYRLDEVDEFYGEAQQVMGWDDSLFETNMQYFSVGWQFDNVLAMYDREYRWSEALWVLQHPSTIKDLKPRFDRDKPLPGEWHMAWCLAHYAEKGCTCGSSNWGHNQSLAGLKIQTDARLAHNEIRLRPGGDR